MFPFIRKWKATAVLPYATLVLGLLCAAGASPLHAQAPAGAAEYRPAPPYAGYPGWYPPAAYTPWYPYNGYAPWWPCAVGPCANDLQVRRAVRRELQQQELRREIEARQAAQSAGAPPDGPGWIYRPPPPPTPESHLQPGYRGTGEIRPEYRDTGRAR